MTSIRHFALAFFLIVGPRLPGVPFGGGRNSIVPINENWCQIKRIAWLYSGKKSSCPAPTAGHAFSGARFNDVRLPSSRNIRRSRSARSNCRGDDACGARCFSDCSDGKGNRSSGLDPFQTCMTGCVGRCGPGLIACWMKSDFRPRAIFTPHRFARSGRST